MSDVSLWTLSRLSVGAKFSPDCAFKTGVEGDLMGDSVESNCGAIKSGNMRLLQVLAVESAGSAGGVKMIRIGPAMSRMMFCCVKLPGEVTPEGWAREGADILALLIDADRCRAAVLRTIFAAGATTALVTNASALLNAKAAMLWFRCWCRELIFERPASESARGASCE